MPRFHLLDHGSNRNALQTSKGYKFLSIQARQAREEKNDQGENKKTIQNKHDFNPCHTTPRMQTLWGKVKLWEYQLE